MKKIALLSFMLVMALVVALAAQAPGGGGPPAGAGGAPGGRGGGQGGPGGGGRGGRGAPVPPAPPALQTVADAVVAAINMKDSAALTKMLAMDCVYLDEDGHAPPCTVAVTRLMSGTDAKMFAISDSHGQMLNDTAAWLSFNYTLSETFRGGPKTLTGTTTMALKKAGNDWTVSLMHTALKQTVAGITQ